MLIGVITIPADPTFNWTLVVGGVGGAVAFGVLLFEASYPPMSTNTRATSRSTHYIYVLIGLMTVCLGVSLVAPVQFATAPRPSVAERQVAALENMPSLYGVSARLQDDAVVSFTYYRQTDPRIHKGHLQRVDDEYYYVFDDPQGLAN